MANTDKLGLPLVAASQAQKHVTVNEALELIDDKLGGGFAPHGATSFFGILEQEVTLTGAAVNTTIQFPSSCIILAVSTRVTAAVTGASSFKVGDGVTADRFGDLLGVTLGATNAGVVGPSGNYSPLPVTLTANGSNFTGGKTRVALHYITIQPPTS